MEQATIHLADKRVPTIFGAQTQAHALVVNDICLEAGNSHHTQSLVVQSVLVVPYIGDVRYNQTTLIEEHQVFCFLANAHAIYELSNPYDSDTINFFEVLIPQPIFANSTLVSAEVQRSPNQLLSVSSHIYIGQYAGRQEGVYEVQNPESQIFVYVISGVFEVQDRLLHPRDGLTLQSANTVAFEALSNDAVMLLIEL